MILPRSLLAALRALSLATLAGFAALAAAGPVAAAELTSRYTPTEGKGCTRTPKHEPEEHERVTDRCRGLGGFTATMVYPATSVRVAIETADKPAPAAFQLGAGYGVGPKIEWRGEKTARGFTPRAAVIRLISRNDAGDLVSVLGVMRVEAQAACPAAWLDVAATPDANTAARRAADEAAAAFTCGRDRPRIIGTETELVKDIAARSN